MFCTKCGKEISDQSKFCPECGAAIEEKKDDNVKPDEIRPANNGFNQVSPAPCAPMNGLAIAGFVLSLVSLFTYYVYLPGIVGLVLSALALSQMKKAVYRGRGLAIAGLVISIVSLSFSVLVLLSCGALGCGLAGSSLL